MMSADAPLEPWALVDEANALLARGEFARAEALLLDCRAEFPAYAPAAAAQAHALGLQGRHEESLSAWRDVVSDYAGAVTAWWLVELARVERRLGDPDEAERHLRRCLDRFTDHTPAAAALAELLTSQSRWSEAQAAWERALRSGSLNIRPWWFVSAAAVVERLGRHAEAQSLLDSMEARFPLARETLDRRARAAAEREDWRAALGDCEAALSADGADPAWDLRSRQALALFRLGRVEEALHAWAALEAAAPDFTPAALAHAAAARELGRWDEVEELYTRLIERDSRSAPACWRVERLRARLQDRRRGVTAADVDELVARFPQIAEPHMLRVEFCFARSQGLRAIAKALEEGLRQAQRSRWLRAEQVRVWLATGDLARAQALADELAAEENDHFSQISQWRILADREGSAALAVAAEAALARAWPLEGGLVLADALLAQFAPWADALAGRLTDDLLCRFSGRPRLACVRARALIALRQDRAAEAVIAALPHLCVSAEALELRAWAAARAGDVAGADVIWRTILGKVWFAALHSPRPDLTRLTPAGPVDDAKGVTAFCNVRNERVNLSVFLAHHRRLGVARFVVVDHGSDDGGTDFLAGQSDVILYRTGDGFQASGAGMRWVNWLVSRHGGSGWRLELDADEAFVYPGWETISLARFVEWLEAEGAEAVASFMLDLYPRRLTGPGGEVAPLADYRYYDPPTGWGGLTRAPWLQPYGGARARLFQVPEVLQKVSLVRRGRAAWLNSHTTTPVRLSSVSGLLLHAKLFNLARRRNRGEAGGNPYMADRTPDLMRRHMRYAACLNDLMSRDLVQEGVSAELVDSLALADLGLMRAPSDYRSWLAAQLPVANPGEQGQAVIDEDGSVDEAAGEVGI